MRLSLPSARYILVILLGAVWPIFVYFCVIPAAHTLTHGFAGYYGAARVLLDGDIARVHDPAWFQSRLDALGFGGVRDVIHHNPPSVALVMLPLVGLPPLTARALWTWANVGLLLATWAVLAVLMRSRVPSHVTFKPVLLLGVALPALASSWENIRWGQIYLLLALCVTLSLWAMLAKRDALAGFFLAPLILTKPYYALFALLACALNRHWWVVASALGTSVAVVALFWPLAGVEAWRRYLAILPTIDSLAYAAHTSHQTVNGLLRHLFVYDSVWSPQPLAAMGLPTVMVLRIVIIGPLLVLTIIHTKKRHDIWWAMATLLAVSLLASPIGEPHHFALLVPALALLLSRGRVPLLGWLGLGLLVVPWPIRDQSLWAGGWALLAYPRLYGTVAVWLALIQPELEAGFGQGGAALPARQIAGQ